MKKLLFLFFSLFVTLGAVAQKPGKEEPEISFQEAEFNFGEIQEGKKVEYIFTFTNTGTKPLLISEVLVTCGCVTAELPVKPITKGNAGRIKVVFDSMNKVGQQNKVLTVFSNAVNSEEKIKVVGKVLPNKKQSQK